MANTSSLARAKGGKGKRPYRRKLENGPKRPLSAYNLFFRAERERILAECQGITINMQTTKKGKRAHRKTHGAVNFSDMGKRIAAAWKALDEAGRAPFVADAAQDMKRYQEAKEEAQQQAAVQKPPCKNNIENEEVAPQSKIQNKESTLFQNSTTQLQTNIAEDLRKKMPHEGITDPNQTAQAFSPPDPSSNNGHPPSSENTTITQDYAFQCEVCHTAIFPSYDECLQHEQECAKNKGRERQNEAETIV